VTYGSLYRQHAFGILDRHCVDLFVIDALVSQFGQKLRSQVIKATTVQVFQMAPATDVV
jgi:hypothetical protein